MARRFIMALAGPALSIIAEAAPAHADVRAVFIGIDTYRYAAVQPEGDAFRNLRGAVNDATRMRLTLNAAYRFGFEEPPRSRCPRSDPTARSITLLNSCATRGAILGAIGAQAAAARPGDTLILYLAGHGGRLIDMNSDRPGSQASGRHSTFLPYDAREPGNAIQGDILDIELGDLVDAALARGIDVIAIADSCNSGTGLRVKVKGRRRPPGTTARRSAPSIAGHRAVSTRYHGPQLGRAVSLAAALDSEESYERPTTGTGTGQIGGAFTTALIAAIEQDPDAPFIDLMTSVRARLAGGEWRVQHPQAEGEMAAGFSAAGLRVRADAAPVFDVVRDGTDLILPADGALVGMTAGSTMALFASARAALDPAAVPLATATVGAVSPGSARLVPLQPLVYPLPGNLFAREIDHVYMRPPIPLRLDERLPGRDRITAALGESRLARMMEAARLTLALAPDGATARLVDQAGTPVAILGPLAAGEFPAQLTVALTRLARVDDLLHRPAATRSTIAMCIAQEDFDPAECGTIGSPYGSTATLAGGLPASLVVINLDPDPHFVTVLAIGADNSIGVVLPRRGGHDSMLEQNMPLVQTLRATGATAGCRYIAIASDMPLDSAALVQDGTLPGTGTAPCGGAIERPWSPRATGAHDLAGPESSVAEFWSTATIDATVAPQGEAAP